MRSFHSKPAPQLLAAALLAVACTHADTHQHLVSTLDSEMDLDRLPAPVIRRGVGHSHLAITTRSPEAQIWFDQGLSLLHCFWDFEALRAFEQAVRNDRDCALCHWGLYRALKLMGVDTQAKQELAKAEALSSTATDHERRYIKADAALEASPGENGQRGYAQEEEALIDRYPNDIEAKLLYALSLNHGYDDDGMPQPGTVYGQSLLSQVLALDPENMAANHYWIHAVEGGPHPERALQSADRLARLASDSGHIVHMPGHIYFEVGDYARARESFLASLRVDQKYIADNPDGANHDWNFAHNLSYLVAACGEAGRYKEALAYARMLEGLGKSAATADSAGYVFQIPGTEARLGIRYARWDEVIDHPLDVGVPYSDLSAWVRTLRDGLLAYARGMKAVGDNRLIEAEGQSALLDALLWRLSQGNTPAGDVYGRDRVSKLLATASLELRGNLAAARGDLTSAQSLLERAARAERSLGHSEPPHYARPSAELLGDILCRGGKFVEAREAYEQALAIRPHSGFALYGIAETWRKEGQTREAIRCYRTFLEAWKAADDDLPQVRSARSFLAAR